MRRGRSPGQNIAVYQPVADDIFRQKYFVNIGLLYCGLVIPYPDTDLGQYFLK